MRIPNRAPPRPATRRGDPVQARVLMRDCAANRPRPVLSARTLRAIAVILGTLLVRGEVLAGQASCSNHCRIVIDTLFQLDAERDTAYTGYPPGATVAAGKLYLVDPTTGQPIAYGLDGRFLGTVGRKGGGPGEHQHAAWLSTGPDQELYSYDAQLARLSVRDRAGAPAWTMGLPGIFTIHNFAVLKDHSIVMDGRPAEPALADFPLMVFSRGSTAPRGFGPPTPTRQGDLVRRSHRLAPSADGGVWAVGVYTQELEKFDRNLRLVERIPARRWFRGLGPGEQPTVGEDGREPTMLARALQEDASGLLWLATNVPANDWRRWLGKRTRSTYGARVNVSRRLSTVIEVFDPGTKAIVAATTARSMIVHSLGAGLFLATADHNGIPSATVVRLRLVSASQ